MKKFFLAFAAMLMAFSVSAAELNIYASGLKAGEVKDGKVEVSYLLNATATALELQLLGADGAVAHSIAISDADLLAKGAHTATIDLAGAPAGTYTWAIKASAEARTEISGELLTDLMGMKGSTYWQPRDMAFDNNPESPFFGQAYVTNSAGTTNAGYIGNQTAIYTFNPLYESQGVYQGGINWAKNGGPYRLYVDKTGLVYASNWSDTDGGIFIMDPANPTVDFKPLFDPAKRGVNYGKITGFDFAGEGADRTLIVNDGGWLNLNTWKQEGAIVKYAIGETNENFAGTPDTLFTSGEATLIDPANQFAADGRGGWWLCQNRADDKTTQHCLQHINAAGVLDYRSATDGLITGGTQSGALEIFADYTMMAVSVARTVKVYAITYAEDGKPSLELKYTTGDIAKTVTGVAIDYAGNILTGSLSSERLYAYALPSDNICTTPAPKANTITVEAAAVVELPETLYLTPNANWNQLGHETQPRFAAYYFEGSANNTWVDMTLVEGETNVYSVAVPEGYTNVIFCRMNGTTTENNWDNKYNQTNDLVIPSDGTNHYTVTEDTWDKGGGVWSVYTPAEKPAGDKYVKVTEAPADWTGTYILVYETSETSANVWTGVDKEANHVAATIADGAIIAEDLVEIKIAAIEGGYSLCVMGGDKAGQYIGATSHKNTISFTVDALVNTLAMDGTNVTISCATGAETAVTMRFNDGTSSGNNRFRYYKTGQQPVQLYKKEIKAVAAIGITLDQATAELEAYKVLQLTATLTPAEATNEITWTSSDENIATVNATGVVTALAPGTATIKAIAAEGIEATCELTVKEATVLTAAAAADIAKTVGANNELAPNGQYVVEAYVQAITSAYNPQYGNMTLALADSRGADTALIVARYTIPADVENLPEVDDKVRVIGDLTKYNGTNQIAQYSHATIIEKAPQPLVFEFNGGTPADAAWTDIEVIFAEFMTDAGATGFETLAHYKAQADPLSSPNICSALANASPALKMPKWAWLKAYIEEVHAAQAADGASALPADGTGAAWRYAVGAFFIDGQRTGWPKSANFAGIGVSSEAWKPSFELHRPQFDFYTAPTKEGYKFIGWFDNEACEGEALTEIPAAGGTIYAGWAIPGLSGVYTIGGEGADYATLAEATAAVNARPIEGDVTLLIAADLEEATNSGIVNTTDFTVTIRPATAEMRTITFNATAKNSGPSGSIVIGSSDPVNGANEVATKNVVIDGAAEGSDVRNLTIVHNNNTGRIVVYGGASDITIQNIISRNTAVAADGSAIQFLGNAGKPGKVLVKGNLIEAANLGLVVHFTNGIGAIIENNTFDMANTMANDFSYIVHGYTVTDTVLVRGNNFINMSTSDAGGNGVLAVSAQGGTWIIENNYFSGMDYTGEAGQATRLNYIRSITGNTIIRHNTFYIPSFTSKPGNTIEQKPVAAIKNTVSCLVENNLFVSNEETALHALVYGPAALNNNVFYNVTTNESAYVKASTTAGQTWADYSATEGITDKFVEVHFTDAAAGDLSLTGKSDGDKALAVPAIAEVTTDITGKARHAELVYAGAFEGGDFKEAPAGPTEMWLTPNWGEITAGGEMFEVTVNFDIEVSEEQLAEGLTITKDREDIMIMGTSPFMIYVPADAEAGQLAVTVSYGGLEAYGFYTIMPAGPSGISILPNTDLEIESLGTLQLTAALWPEDAEANIIWWSSDETLATVDQTGLVTSLVTEQDTTVQIFAAAEGFEGIEIYVDVKLLGAKQETALENVNVEVKTTKVIRNGQVIIIRGKEEYNVLGTKIQ